MFSEQLFCAGIYQGIKHGFCFDYSLDGVGDVTYTQISFLKVFSSFLAFTRCYLCIYVFWLFWVFVAVLGLSLGAQSPHCVAPLRGAQALGTRAPVAAAQGLRSCSSQALECGRWRCSVRA